ncbi:hypothetical protein QCA50_010884 [Cerrena zonata]|uniref:Uncharacterized protein n=1 Tax=Cerrena zonata TaxID=2478898 RepID=A0AAW0G3G5_9APHY
MNILTPTRFGIAPLFNTHPTILLSTRRASSSKARKQSGGGIKTGSLDTPPQPKLQYGPERSPVDVFFAPYPSFKHKRTQPLPDEYLRLFQEELKRKEHKNDFTSAMADELYFMYGRTESRKAGYVAMWVLIPYQTSQKIVERKLKRDMSILSIS